MQRVKCATHRRDTRLVKLGRRRDGFERCQIAKLRRTRKVTTWPQSINIQRIILNENQYKIT